MSLFKRARKSGSARRVAAATPRFRPALEALEDRRCPTTGLVAPTILSVTANSPTQATVSWTNVQNETGYKVLEWKGGTAVTAMSVAADVTTATITNLPPHQTVWFSIDAFNATTDAQSFWSSVALPAEALTPATGLTATAASPTELDLNWTAAVGETGYHVYQWKNGHTDLIASVAAGQTTAAVTGLSAGSLYYFTVEAYNDTSSAMTDWASGTTLAQPISAPTGLTLTPGTAQVGLSWTGSTGATGYAVFEWNGGQALMVGQTGPAITTFNVSNLQAGTSYWFYVEAFNASNAASTSWQMATTTASATPLNAPANLHAQTTADGQLQLTWTASNHPNGYWVYAWTGTTWQVVASPGAAATSVTLSAATVGQSKYFLVEAYDNNFSEFAASNTLQFGL